MGILKQLEEDLGHVVEFRYAIDFLQAALPLVISRQLYVCMRILCADMHDSLKYGNPSVTRLHHAERVIIIHSSWRDAQAD